MDSYLRLFQRRCHELEEANVQTKILLESSQADKNHISRVMQQNEKLKNEFQELQLQLARVVSISLKVGCVFPMITISLLSLVGQVTIGKTNFIFLICLFQIVLIKSTENADMTIKMGTLEHSLNKSLQQIEENDGIELDKNQWR